MDHSDTVTAVQVCQAPTALDADDNAERMRRCPYVASYTSTGNLCIGVFVIPPEKRSWLEKPANEPALMGMEQIHLNYVERGDVSSPWSRGEVRPVLDTPPCGSDCPKCPEYEFSCRGCIATVLYLHK